MYYVFLVNVGDNSEIDSETLRQNVLPLILYLLLKNSHVDWLAESLDAYTNDGSFQAWFKLTKCYNRRKNKQPYWFLDVIIEDNSKSKNDGRQLWLRLAQKRRIKYKNYRTDDRHQVMSIRHTTLWIS